jgi:nucleoside 2-deoxyribosyltransferase
LSVKPFAFVLMPFDPAFNDIYKLGIKATADELGVVAERVDEQRFSETMLDRIYRQIDAADFIIADMTGKNPNVFYEVGYAHARGKLCTLLTQSASDIPFDLKHHRHIVYHGSITELKLALSKEIEWLMSERKRQKTSPVTIELRRADGELEKSAWKADAIVDFEFDINNRTLEKSPEIEAIYLHTGPNWTFKQGVDQCPSTPSEVNPGQLRHFIKPPITRLSPGAWGRVKLVGRKTVWVKWEGDEVKDSYHLTGYVKVDIFTSEGTFTESMDLTVEVDDAPF